MCDHTVEYWQLSINLCQFFNFLLHVTGKSYHFLRFNYLEMCYFLVYLHICETQVYNCTGSAIFGIPHPKVLWQTSFHVFLLNTLSLPSFYCFAMELSPCWCWFFLFNQLTLLLRCLNVVKQWHQEKWMPLKM